jgi:anti-sigma regulatory factor (Ser/Thr protein kinase)
MLRATPVKSRLAAVAPKRDQSVGSNLARVGLTGLILFALCVAIGFAQKLIPDSRPALVYFLIPIAFGAAVLGPRGGIVVGIVALAVARWTVSWSPKVLATPTSDFVEFFGLSLAAVIIVAVIGQMHTSLHDLRELHEKVIEADSKVIEADRKLILSEERRLAFNREVLLAVTGSRLLLCDNDEIAGMLTATALLTVTVKQPKDVTDARLALRRRIAEVMLPTTRLYELETCVTEATTNALKHAGFGTMELYRDGDDVIVVVTDNGPGIAPADLARATLEKGFSTRVSLGMGFKMMWELADMLAVSTSAEGTKVLIRMGEGHTKSFEDSILDRYPSIDV